MRYSDFRHIVFTIACILSPILLFGQYYNLGQDPASLKWREITTSHFRLIYPESFEQKAQKMISSLDITYSSGTKTLAYKPERIPVIIHNYTIIPNAVTVWAPRRIELFTCPPQDMYAQDWLTQLMLHEYRHVIQIERTNQGFTRVLSWLAGEQAASAINGLFVPSWFMEGDAVCTETALSKSGRGRIPNFEMELRAQVMQKGAYSYDKAAMRSYKTFVPNQYVLGYSLVANVRRRYGYQAWVNALDEVARKPFIVTPFNRGLKKATGFGKEQLYRTTMTDMDSMWKYQDEHTLKTNYKQLSVIHKSKYENYIFPQYLTDSLVITEFTSLDDITRFIITGTDGYKKTVATPGYLSSEIFSVFKAEAQNQAGFQKEGDNSGPGFLLAWTETINDPRWEQRNYSVIRIYNSCTNKIKALTSKSRYFAPAFSPDGRSVAAVSVDPSNHNSIVLIDVYSGEETATVIASDSDFYMTPSWSADGNRIVYTKLGIKGKSINSIELKTREIKTLLASTFTEISNPVFAGDYVLFNGAFSGIENIYAINIQSKEIFQVTSAQYGASNAHLSPDGKRIVYSNYSSEGYNLAEAVFNPGVWKKLSEIRDYSPSLYKHLVKEEAFVTDTTQAENAVLPSQPYKKAAHIFNFHSWAPAYINYMDGENGAGISFMSQNELSTATTVVGYKYDMTENTGKVTADFSWKAWYPVIDLKTSYGARTAYTDSSVRYNYNQSIISGGITLPLIFTGGKYYKGMNVQIHTSWINYTDNTSPKPNKFQGVTNSLDYGFYAYRYIKQSGKDLYPRWGQTFSFNFRHSPFGDIDYGQIISVASRIYFPGLFRHHGIRMDFNWQKRVFTHYYFPNQIYMPRGYYISHASLMKCFAFNYKFPIVYPDLSLGPFAYIKRLKANLFFDGGVQETDGISYNMQSTGIEITSDLHFLRFAFPVDIGFRFGFRPVETQYFMNLLFSVNLPD